MAIPSRTRGRGDRPERGSQVAASPEALAEWLANHARVLQERGQADLAQDVREVAGQLRRSEAPEPAGDLLTTGEAATLLGVRSVNTIKRWARDGLLDGFRRGGRVLVSRESVQRLGSSPALAAQQQAEHHLDADLSAFGADEGQPVPPLDAAWQGRKP